MGREMRCEVGGGKKMRKCGFRSVEGSSMSSFLFLSPMYGERCGPGNKGDLEAHFTFIF